MGIGIISSDWIVQVVRDSNQGIENRDRAAFWVIGDREFILSVMEKSEQRLRNYGVLREKWSIADVFKRLSEEYTLTPADLKKAESLTNDIRMHEEGFVYSLSGHRLFS